MGIQSEPEGRSHFFILEKNIPYFGDGEEQEQLILGVGFGIDQFEIAFSFSPYL